jgi:hypothetical protein
MDPFICFIPTDRPSTNLVKLCHKIYLVHNNGHFLKECLIIRISRFFFQAILSTEEEIHRWLEFSEVPLTEVHVYVYSMCAKVAVLYENCERASGVKDSVIISCVGVCFSDKKTSHVQRSQKKLSVCVCVRNE